MYFLTIIMGSGFVSDEYLSMPVSRDRFRHHFLSFSLKGLAQTCYAKFVSVGPSLALLSSASLLAEVVDHVTVDY